jgi:GGDEF domain-containing protein
MSMPERRAGTILVVGDIGRAFLDTPPCEQYGWRIETNALDAVAAAATNQFDAVAVVTGGLFGQLAPVLKALRKSTDAKIVLLAQMYEEPLVRRLAERVPDSDPLADGYLICPTASTNLVRMTARRSDVTTVDSRGDVASHGLQPSADLEQRIRHLEWLATTDDLTGLKNRRYVLEFARQILVHAERNAGRVTLLVFDIDNFKHYNDRYGHATGDEILRQAALLMQRCCRRHDVVGRIGGDEFAVVFWDDPLREPADVAQERRSSGCDHPTEPILVAERFRNEFGRAELHLLGPQGDGVLTVSGGLASFPRDGRTVRELFEKADSALLEAKRSGKNRIYLVGEPPNDIAELSQ